MSLCPSNTVVGVQCLIMFSMVPHTVCISTGSCALLWVVVHFYKYLCSSTSICALPRVFVLLHG